MRSGGQPPASNADRGSAGAGPGRIAALRIASAARSAQRVAMFGLSADHAAGTKAGNYAMTRIANAT
jgi:hypothetical protein